MGISFAGQDVLLDAEETATYFDDAFPRDWHGEHSPPLLEWPSIPYAWPPHLPTQLHVGDLYWPTGAMRWACCYLLANTTMKDAIIAGLSADGSGTLVLGDVTPIEATMYLLPPRRLASAGELWLLPLVDQRYWWQYATTASAVVVTQGTTTWANVISALQTQLSIASLTTSTIPAPYLFPDTETITRYQGNPAALLDAVAASIGMHVVVGLDGRVAIQSADDGLDVLTANRRKTYTLTAGGAFDMTARNIPSAVSVAFRQRNFNTNQIQGIASYSKPATGVPASVELTGPVKMIRSACYADVTTAGFGNTPDNNTALEALAGQIAADYYNGLTEQYEYKFNSMIDWAPCFYDDYQIYSFGTLRMRDFGRDAGVRVRSWTFNCQPADQLQQGNFPSLTPGYVPPSNAPVSVLWEGYMSHDQDVTSALEALHFGLEAQAVPGFVLSGASAYELIVPPGTYLVGYSGTSDNPSPPGTHYDVPGFVGMQKKDGMTWTDEPRSYLHLFVPTPANPLPTSTGAGAYSPFARTFRVVVPEGADADRTYRMVGGNFNAGITSVQPIRFAGDFVGTSHLSCNWVWEKI
ncbi:MAG: hypothetical protein K8T91_20095 [Planctomycetes bacterium]|nr:hypothetical protein [Planctomycetota bacterium]